MTTVALPANKWQPRGYQTKLWRYLEGGGRRALAFWHRRAGKDNVALHWTACAAHQRIGNYWHMLPQAAQGRKAIWHAVNAHTGMRLIDEAFPLALRSKTLENEMMIKFKCGSTWQVIGSDNYHNLVGASTVGLVASEWSRADPEAWAYLRPILRENKGWAIFITTPYGKNHAWDMLQAHERDEAWFTEILSVAKTKALSLEAIEDERQEFLREYGPTQGRAYFEQEYLCSFEAAIIGSIYGADLQAMRDADPPRIGRVPIDKGLPVHTSWDLGRADATAIWFIQVKGREVRLVDYHEQVHAVLPDYAKVINDKKAQHDWNYADHWFPHDISHKDIQVQESRVQTLANLGIRPRIVPLHPIQDGINATHRLLDRCYIDAERCRRGLDALYAYQYEWDSERKLFSPKPLHNWSSHGADSLRTFAAGFYEPAVASVRQSRYQREEDVGGSWMTA